MSTYLSRLNPAERRFVIIVGLVFFVVINALWIFPHFSDWGNLQIRLADARNKLANYETTIAKIPVTKAEIAKLVSDGINVPPEDQSFQFLRTIQMQAAQSGLGPPSSQHSATSTNQFFIEQAQTISVVAGEKQLVDFLYSLGSSNSLVRVRDLALRPEPNHQSLNANVTLVASFQKNLKAAAAKPAAPKPAAPKPATPPGPSPKPGVATNSPARTNLPAPLPPALKPKPNKQ
jgi:hypothetical protein